MKYPFKQKRISENILIREFSSTVNKSDLIWHMDKSDRKVTVKKGSGWKLQFDNQLPVELKEGKTYFIPKETYHRVIKGRGKLVVQINEENKKLTEVRNLIRKKISEKPNLTEGQLLNEVIGILLAVGAALLGVLGVGVAAAFKTFFGGSMTTANGAITNWARDNNIDLPKDKNGNVDISKLQGKDAVKAAGIGIKAILDDLPDVLPALQKLDDIDPLPPKGEEEAKKYQEEMEKIGKETSEAAGQLMGAMKAIAELLKNKEYAGQADRLSDLKPMSGGDIWHMAYGASIGIGKLINLYIEKSKSEGVQAESINSEKISGIVSWCQAYSQKIPDSKTPQGADISNMPSSYADPELAEAAREVIKGSIDPKEIESWDGTIAHFLPSIWANLLGTELSEEERKEFEEKSNAGIDAISDQISDMYQATKITALPAIKNDILDNILFTQPGEDIPKDLKDQLDFMGNDKQIKYFFDPRYGDGYKNRIWAFGLALTPLELKDVTITALGDAKVPFGMIIGPDSNVEKSYPGVGDPGYSMEAAMQALKPIVEGCMYLALQQGKSGKYLAGFLGLISNGKNIPPKEVYKFFENTHTNKKFKVGNFAEKFWAEKWTEHMSDAKPNKGAFVKHILPPLMKKADELNAVPNMALWNFILTGKEGNIRDYGKGDSVELGQLVVESAIDRWAKLAGIKVL